MKVGPMSKSNITWCDYSWRPVTGCTRVSPACENCYAETTSGIRLGKHARYAGTTKKTSKGHRWTGLVKTHPELLTQPTNNKKGGRVFVCGMSDLFHKDVPTDFVLDVFKATQDAPQHTFIILTKRPERVVEIEGHEGFPGWPDNVWFGTTVESNDYAHRVDYVRNSGAKVKWVSAEPLLGSNDEIDLSGIDWIVIGGESGHGARPMDLEGVRDLMVTAESCGTAIHIKQMGTAWARGNGYSAGSHATNPEQWEPEFRVRQWPAERPRLRNVIPMVARRIATFLPPKPGYHRVKMPDGEILSIDDTVGDDIFDSDAELERWHAERPDFRKHVEEMKKRELRWKADGHPMAPRDAAVTFNGGRETLMIPSGWMEGWNSEIRSKMYTLELMLTQVDTSAWDAAATGEGEGVDRG